MLVPRGFDTPATKPCGAFLHGRRGRGTGRGSAVRRIGENRLKAVCTGGDYIACRRHALTDVEIDLYALGLARIVATVYV